MEVCKLLLERGAKKDGANHLGWAPLHEASFYNHVDVCKLLLVYGADATARNHQGCIPYELASFPEVIRTFDSFNVQVLLQKKRDDMRVSFK